MPPRCSTSAPGPDRRPRSLARSLLGVAANADEPRAARLSSERVAGRSAATSRSFVHDLADVPPPPALARPRRRHEPGGAGHAVRLGRSPTWCAGPGRARRSSCSSRTSTGPTPRPSSISRELAALAGRQPILLVMTTRFAGDPSAGAWRSALHGAPLVGIDLALVDRCRHRRSPAPRRRSRAGIWCQLRRAGRRATRSSCCSSCSTRGGGRAQLARVDPGARACTHGSSRSADKRALQAAAVLGQRSRSRPLRHLIAAPGCDVRSLIDHFLRAGADDCCSAMP